MPENKVYFDDIAFDDPIIRRREEQERVLRAAMDDLMKNAIGVQREPQFKVKVNDAPVQKLPEEQPAPAPEPEMVKVAPVYDPFRARELILIRGIPGSGKSTLAHSLHQCFDMMNVTCDHLEADMFFTSKYGVYNFDPSKLEQAHKWCREQVQDAFIKKITKVIVSNTFVFKVQMEPYLKMAKQYGYFTQVLICAGNFTSIHDVPKETIRRMSQNFEF